MQEYTYNITQLTKDALPREYLLIVATKSDLTHHLLVLHLFKSDFLMLHLLPRRAILRFQVWTHRLLTILMLIALPSQVFLRVRVFISIHLMKRWTRLSLLVELPDHSIELLHL
jgi:hypothetical protein